MAIKRLTIDGFGQLEINNCAFRRDGRVEAQCAPNTTDFATAKVENGMLLAVDNVNREVKFAANGNLPIAIVYSAEHLYRAEAMGLKDFALNGKEDFLPRLGYLAVGDKITTNCVCYDSSEFSTEDALLADCANKAKTIYGGAGANGAIKLSATAPTFGPKLRVTGKTTMPDGTVAIKLQCYTA